MHFCCKGSWLASKDASGFCFSSWQQVSMQEQKIQLCPLLFLFFGTGDLTVLSAVEVLKTASQTHPGNFQASAYRSHIIWKEA